MGGVHVYSAKDSRRVAGMLRGLTAAKQLLWLLVVTTATGIGLVVPDRLLPASTFADTAASLLRGVHSLSSMLLVAASLVHAIRRMAVGAVTWRSFVSGYTASITVAIAAMTGAVLADTAWWSDLVAVPAAALDHGMSVFHFGYSAALGFGVLYWHVRVAGVGALLPWDRSTALVVFLALAAGLFVATTGGTRLLSTEFVAPRNAALAWWTLAMPTLLWAWPRGRRPAGEPRPSKLPRRSVSRR